MMRVATCVPSPPKRCNARLFSVDRSALFRGKRSKINDMGTIAKSRDTKLRRVKAACLSGDAEMIFGKSYTNAR